MWVAWCGKPDMEGLMWGPGVRCLVWEAWCGRVIPSV